MICSIVLSDEVTPPWNEEASTHQRTADYESSRPSTFVTVEGPHPRRAMVSNPVRGGMAHGRGATPEALPLCYEPVRRLSRRSWRPPRRSSRRCIPPVWASASDAVCIVATAAKPAAAASPRRENALRREIISDVIFDVIFSFISNLPDFASSHYNERGARACVQNCSVRPFLWSKSFTWELLFAVVFRAEQRPSMRSGLRGLRCSRCSPIPEIYS